ncbi:MAG: DEAD/DEAH box helicase [Methylotetracoccus sp.]
MVLSRFHPAVSSWFRSAYPGPTDCQSLAWAAIKDERHVLVSAPTGSGKTLAAFLAVIDDLVREGDVFGLPDQTRIVYVSPLKALSNDIQRNLEAPLSGINRACFERGGPPMVIRSVVRTGDTPAAVRAAMLRNPPHIVVTTPESLYLLLTSEGGRRMLGTVRTVIVDEIHAVVGSKRGAHLAISLERLERLIGGGLRRIGLSATQRPIDEVVRFLTGGSDRCTVVDEGHRRDIDLGIELPSIPLEAVPTHQASTDIHDRIAELIRAHRTTLVFVNTRRQAERLARALSDRLGTERVTSHHGSLSRHQRLEAEERLKAGSLSALVATASLELGIDVGDVDLVCQVGTTGSIATALQRIGRSGHSLSGLPKGRLFPTTRDDLIECLALIRAIRDGELDALRVPVGALDVLAQQIVAMVAIEDWDEQALYDCLVRAHPYRNLDRAAFDAVVRMLADGYATRRGLRGAYLHRDGIHRRLRGRRSARLAAVTCGGAIPDAADYQVVLEPAGDQLGTVDEHFAIESIPGDVFQLGNNSWRVLGLEGPKLRVTDASGIPPTIPFWFGEAPGRSDALSIAVSRLREDVAEQATVHGIDKAVRWLEEQTGETSPVCVQAVHYLVAGWKALGVMPTRQRIVFERFFDESGGMQFIVHSPYGSRVNRAWGLALRKRFCRTFNFELQAAANENALILSLGVSQSFPLEDIKGFLRANSVRPMLVQALLDAPMFTIRWRWNAVCSLAVRRFQNGRRVPPHLLRMQAEDLVTSVFPDQLACLENIRGEREIPDHPLVQQTIEDCLTEAMDLPGLISLLTQIEQGSVEIVCRDLLEPSPLAAEIVNARAYSFLDGAPLEERRTRAVRLPRGIDLDGIADPAPLDGIVVEAVRRAIWPRIRDAEELHEALQVAGFLSGSDGIDSERAPLLRVLLAQGRATRLRMRATADLWIAAERWPQFRAVFPDTSPEPALSLPEEIDRQTWSADEALTEIVRGRLSVLGPVTAMLIACSLGLDETTVRAVLIRLEGEGTAVRGAFGDDGLETWCERSVLARIRRETLGAARRRVDAVSVEVYRRFLLRWQHLHPETVLRGEFGLAAVLEQLEGFEAPAWAWEAGILPARIADYEPLWLDHLCQSGRFAWLRLAIGEGARTTARTTPIAIMPRHAIAFWRRGAAAPDDSSALSGEAANVHGVLHGAGALFFDELITRCAMPRAFVERALAELVAGGLVSADGFAGLRALVVPESRRQRYKGLNWGMEHAGRWSAADTRGPGPSHDETIQAVTRALLRRYGVLFRGLVQRERASPPWHELLPWLRRLEAQGEIRAGRFIAGQFGEQFALPEAAGQLRACAAASDTVEITVGAADPLNLLGLLDAQPRVPVTSDGRVRYQGGLAFAIGNARGLAGTTGSGLTDDANLIAVSSVKSETAW